MIVPSTVSAVILLALLSMLCLGLWPSLFKASRSWRFELFYFDFALGSVILSLIAAFTLGSMGDELSFSDNLLITGKRQMAAGIVAGGMLNLGYMLTLAGLSLTGMSVALPISAGMAFLLGSVLIPLITPVGERSMVYAGAAAVAVALALMTASYFGGGGLRSAKRGSSVKGIVVAFIGGFFIGLSYPLMVWSRQSEIGLGAYSVAVFVAAGMFLSTLVLNLYFMNLPIQGKPVPFTAYFQGGVRNHVLGLLGGMVFLAGLLAWLAASGASRVNVPTNFVFSVAHFAIVVAGVVGMLVFKEWGPAPARARMLFALAMLLFVAGLALTGAMPMLDTWGAGEG